MSAADVLAAVLLLSGSVLALSAAVGLHRLPDVYARMHASTKPITLGFALCLAAAIVQVDDAASRTKLALAIVLQFVTAPVAAHLLGRAAHAHRMPTSRHTAVDELEEPEPGGDEEGADRL